MSKSEATTPRPMEGIWTLIAPDGRTWQAGSPIRVVAAESRERIPAEVALQRIYDAADEPTELEKQLLATLAELAEAATRLERAYVTQWGENSYTLAAHNAGAKARAAIAAATTSAPKSPEEPKVHCHVCPEAPDAYCERNCLDVIAAGDDTTPNTTNQGG